MRQGMIQLLYVVFLFGTFNYLGKTATNIKKRKEWQIVSKEKGMKIYPSIFCNLNKIFFVQIILVIKGNAVNI